MYYLKKKPDKIKTTRSFPVLNRKIHGDTVGYIHRRTFGSFGVFKFLLKNCRKTVISFLKFTDLRY